MQLVIRQASFAETNSNIVQSQDEEKKYFMANVEKKFWMEQTFALEAGYNLKMKMLKKIISYNQRPRTLSL